LEITRIIPTDSLNQLVCRAAKISGASIRLLSVEREIIASSTDEFFDEEETLGLSYKGLYIASLEAAGGHELSQVLEWLGEDITSRITAWHDVDTMAQHIAENYEELNCVFDIIHDLPSLTKFDFLGNGASVLQSTAGLFGAHRAYMILQEEEEDECVVLLSWSGRDVERKTCRIDELAGTPWSSCFETGIAINAATEGDLPEGVSLDGERVELPLLGVRLEADGKPIGAVCFSGKTVTNYYSSTEAKLITTIAAHTASQLSNYRLFQDVREMFLNALTALSNAIESRDEYTQGHIERVTEYSLEIAREVGLEPEHIELLRIAAMMHDLGKIGIPDNVLLKEGKLTDEEFQLMTTHTLIGPKILKGIKQLEPLIPWIQGHHERQDGNGYPLGLKGKEIPLEAQIISVADAFDAMTSNRPYRGALSPQVATERLLEGIGTQFSGDLVNAFLKTSRYQKFCE
jgi:GAF domain-containing protein